MKCPLCQLDNELVKTDTSVSWNWGSLVECVRCGRFQITERAIACEGSQAHRHLICGLTRYFSEFVDKPLVVKSVHLETQNRSDSLEPLIQTYRPATIEAKLDRLVTYFATRSKYPGDRSVWVNPEYDYPLVFAETAQELTFYLAHMKERGWLTLGELASGKQRAILTASGWEKFEKLNALNPDSKQCFVAMSFARDQDYIFNDGIQPVEKETGFQPLRIDQLDHLDKICDRIVAEIKRSRFVIADVTEGNVGAYFEAGYAMGLGLPVIFTAKEGSPLHFDTRQYNHIFWKDTDDLRVRLIDRINATIPKVKGLLQKDTL